MSWNYRIIARKDHDDFHFAIHEVYYDENGNPTSWTERDVGIAGYSLDELKQAYKHYGIAFKKPILFWDEEKDELHEKTF